MGYRSWEPKAISALDYCSLIIGSTHAPSITKNVSFSRVKVMPSQWLRNAQLRLCYVFQWFWLHLKCYAYGTSLNGLITPLNGLIICAYMVHTCVRSFFLKLDNYPSSLVIVINFCNPIMISN